MLYREIIVVCSEIHKKHTTTTPHYMKYINSKLKLTEPHALTHCGYLSGSVCCGKHKCTTALHTVRGLLV